MKNSSILRFLTVLIPLLAACSSPATPTTIYETVSAGTLKPGSPIPAPTGEVVLTIDGKISQTNSDGVLKFDMATLESIGVVQYDLEDPFDKKKTVYAGVLFSEFLKVIGTTPDATTLHLKALDDYEADLKIADATRWPSLLATRADGAYMPTDNKGPVFNVFPFDDFSEIDHTTYDALSVWSLSHITVQ